MSYLSKRCWEIVRNGKVLKSRLTRADAENEIFKCVRDYDNYAYGIKSVSSSPSFDHFKITYYPFPNNRQETDVARLEIVKMKDDEDVQDETVEVKSPSPKFDIDKKNKTVRGDLSDLFTD